MRNVFETTREHIKRIFPGTEDVEIKVRKDPQGNFISRIHVRGKKGVLHAQKSADNLRKSLDRSYLAIRKQVERLRS